VSVIDSVTVSAAPGIKVATGIALSSSTPMKKGRQQQPEQGSKGNT